MPDRFGAGVPPLVRRDDLAGVTVVQIDAHADLADELHGRRWSHGTVMRRLWEQGCRLVQIGIRSLSREEYEVATAGPRIATYYAHRLEEQWAEVLETLRGLEGKVYLTIDVDGLDPSIIPSTGTPLPGGLVVAADDGRDPRADDESRAPADRGRHRRVRPLAGPARLRSDGRPAGDEAAGVVVDGAVGDGVTR